MRDASHSQNTGTPIHIRMLPTTMTSTRSAATVPLAAVRMACECRCYQAWSAPHRGQSTEVETPAENEWPHPHA
jgi:hypothetical protein